MTQVLKASNQTKRGKKLEGIVDPQKLYSLKEAVDLAVKTATAKFDESIEMHFFLGIDPKKTEQQIRSIVALPRGTGKTKRVAVVAKGEKQREAQVAGADPVGDQDLIERISKGYLDFDVLVATPDAMKELSKLGKILGPKGLMPNPKIGTVTFDLARTIKEIKAGRIELRSDALGNIHAGIGKKSLSAVSLYENAQALWSAVTLAKPASVKGIYIRSVTVCSTMGPGIHVSTTADVKSEA